MTSGPARAGWSAPAVLAPFAAALFGASVWWAGGAVPTTASINQPAPTSSVGRSPTAARYLTEVTRRRHVLHRELAQGLAARRREADLLLHRLHRMHREIARAKHAAAVAATYRPAPISYASPQLAPIRMAVPPAPPPPVQANTGASGGAP